MKTMFLLLLALTINPAFATEKAKGMDPEMMKKWMAYSTPGANHKILADMTGSWTYTSKSWEDAKATTPMESKGTSKLKMILGGRFLQHDVKGMAMGHPFTGMSIIGYDNVKEKFETVWIDSMGTGMTRGEGSFDAATKTLKDKGEYTCPMTSDKDRDYHSEWKILDKDNMVFTMYGEDMNGDDHKMMEMTMKRAK